MANVKRLIQDWSETGKTVYAIVRREADNYLLNDADGSFASAPTDPYLNLPENGTIKGRYEVNEARAAWQDGKYTVAVYKQSGASPALASDTIIGSGELFIVADQEVDHQMLYSRVLELRDGNVKRVFNIATSQILDRNVDVGQIDSLTIMVKSDTAADWSSPVSTKTLLFVYAGMGDSDPIRVGD